MTIWAALLAAAAVCVPPASPPPGAPKGSSYQNDGMPPKRFRGDATHLIQFMSPDQVETTCDGGHPTCGFVVEACTYHGKITMPNPCLFPDDDYARLLCHEGGHDRPNGWPATHGP